jgi:hypothetical protein
MRVPFLAVMTVAALVLGGCSSSDDAPTPVSTVGAKPAPTSDASSGKGNGAVDCSQFTMDELTAFVMFTQLLGQMRSVSDLGIVSQLGYQSADVAAMLDKLDHLKGIKGEVYGTPDEGLAAFRSANDTVGAIIAKGDAAADADFAPLAAMWPSQDVWIQQQASITGALNVACPDLK